MDNGFKYRGWSSCFDKGLDCVSMLNTDRLNFVLIIDNKTGPWGIFTIGRSLYMARFPRSRVNPVSYVKLPCSLPMRADSFSFINKPWTANCLSPLFQVWTKQNRPGKKKMPQRIYTTCDKIEDFQKVLKLNKLLNWKLQPIFIWPLHPIVKISTPP